MSTRFDSYLAFGIAMGIAGHSSFGCPLSFMPGQSCGIGRLPGFLTSADFNSDGNPDLASCTRYDTVLILLGTGTGQFAAGVDYPVGTAPDYAISGDVNNDGKSDLIVANRGSSNISVMFGNGDGSFQLASHYFTGASPASIDIADFNTDGFPDLVVGNDLSDTISVLLGNGSGTFPAAANYNLGSHGHSVAAADFNGDGRPDVAVNNYLAHSISILMSNPDGSLQAPVNYGVYPHPHRILVGDFNGDGVIDLAAPNQFNSFSILIGNLPPNRGTFRAPVTYSTGGFPTNPRIADMDGDGILDLIAAEGQGTSVKILLGSPTARGTFLPFATYATLAAPMYPTIADFNLDGRLDFAVSSFDDNYIGVYLNSGASAVINQQPLAQTLQPNQSVFFSLTATGSNLTFQWRRGGVALTNGGRIGGADTAALTISNAQLSDQGDYDCVVSSSCNSVTSATVQLSCRPTFVSNPLGGSYFGGDQIQLSASVQPAGPVTYRWRKNGANLFNSSIYSGVSTAVLTINATDPTQSGQYVLAATNSCGTTLSGSANVVITCRADFNGDDGVDFFDYLDFVDVFSSNDSRADFNGDGSIDFFDYLDFVDRFSIGC